MTLAKSSKRRIEEFQQNDKEKLKQAKFAVEVCNS